WTGGAGATRWESWLDFLGTDLEPFELTLNVGGRLSSTSSGCSTSLPMVHAIDQGGDLATLLAPLTDSGLPAGTSDRADAVVRSLAAFGVGTVPLSDQELLLVATDGPDTCGGGDPHDYISEQGGLTDLEAAGASVHYLYFDLSSNIEDADVLTNTTAATTGTVHAITSPADLDDALEQILLSTLNCTFSLPSDFANADSLEVELGGTPISELGGGT